MQAVTRMQVFTIGHSNRQSSYFLTLLEMHNITMLIDIRAYPHSRRYPHFGQQKLSSDLGYIDISYYWMGRALGGMRKANSESQHKSLPMSLRGFADHMETAKFVSAIDELLNVSERTTTAIMCAERDPDQCHRSLISDYLSLARNVGVVHILDKNQYTHHQARPELRYQHNKIVYDLGTQNQIDI